MSERRPSPTESWLVRHWVSVGIIVALVIFLLSIGLSIRLGILDVVLPGIEMEPPSRVEFVVIVLVVSASAIGVWALIR